MKILFLLLIPTLLFPVFSSAQESIVDGDLIRAKDSFDIYIVKLAGAKQFKRLILNPEIFNSYGHLKWENVKTVASSTLAEFTLSEFVIEVNADGTVFDPKVYKVSSAPDSDIGERRWLNITASEFTSLGYDWDSIYHINHTEAAENFYPIKPPLAYDNLKQVVTPKPPVDKSQVISFSRTDCDAEVPTSHATIQSAIDGAKSGDTICLLAGAYKESVTIAGKNIILSGAGATSSTIMAVGGSAIIVKNVSAETLIENITIEKGSDYGILVEDASPQIKNNIIKNNFAGMRILGNSRPDIRHNVFADNARGSAIVHNGDVGDYAISRNTFVDNGNTGGKAAILLDAAFSSLQIKITNNIFSGGVLGIHEAVPSNSVINNNLFYGQSENYVRKGAVNYNSVSLLNELTFADNNIAGAPQLDASYRPGAGSPAIGAADDRSSNIGAY
jgi:parallel beta-helix repeat protein